MHKTQWYVSLWICVFIIGCGPDTIFVRPALDTPSQHVANGNQLLERGKIDDAHREFERARELDPQCVNAYIGLGMVLATKGDIDAGMENLSMAEGLADSDLEVKAVQDGYVRLNELKRSLQKP